MILHRNTNLSVSTYRHHHRTRLLRFLALYELSSGGAATALRMTCPQWPRVTAEACLPGVPVAAVGAVRRGLAGGACPRPCGPAAPTGDERTCWHGRFLYRQEVGGAAEQMPYIICRIPEPATCRERERGAEQDAETQRDILEQGCQTHLRLRAVRDS